MSDYYNKFKALVDAGHDPETSPEIAALRKAFINLNYGGNDKINVSTEGVKISRVAMTDEDKAELDWHAERQKQQENFEKYGASLEDDKKLQQ